MLEPGRNYSIANTNYRYGFNGKENDNDIENGMQDYGMRIYDGRLGRFISMDPIASDYAFYSPYQFAGNKPVIAADLDGMEEWMKSQELALKREAQIRLVSAYQNQATIRAYNPADKSFTQKWRDSKNFFSRVTYSMANGVYTFPQQMTATLRGSDFVYNIGGDAYHAHGIEDEKQRLNNFADFVSTVMPGATAETEGVSLFNKVADNTLMSIENQVEDQSIKQTAKRIGWTGKIGEDYLKTLGGVPQKYFRTEVGKGGRFVDQFVNGIAYEAKTGYTTLTNDIQMQIEKDKEILGTYPEVKKVTWTFFESPVTGKAGASKPLLKALKDAGIETQIIKPK